MNLNRTIRDCLFMKWRLYNRRKLSYESRNRYSRGEYGHFNWKNATLLTGGAGFIGAAFAIHLTDTNSDVCDTKRTLNEHGYLSKLDAIKLSRDLVMRRKDITGSPGMVIAVSVNGKIVWEEGIGFADMENRVVCKPSTVMRIASISKPITMALAARLWEEGMLDLDAPIQKYLKSWPDKMFEKEKVTITTSQLASHISGVRHYDRSCKKIKEKLQKPEVEKGDLRDGQNNQKNYFKMESINQEVKHPPNYPQVEINKDGLGAEKKMPEYYIMNRMTMEEAVDLFKFDELCFKPGTLYLYSTHGYSLIAAIIESITGEKFTSLATNLFHDLGMNNTYLDENEPLIFNRARFYVKNKRGHVVNAPYVDCSYKFAGGGILSTAGDIARFGQAMLYSYQSNSNGNANTLLKNDTVKLLWTPVKQTKNDWDKNGYYGMGWGVVLEETKYGVGEVQRFNASHTGGAIGGSSTLTILPPHSSVKEENHPEQGVVVAIITNMQGVGLYKTSLEIAKIFEKVKEL